MFCRLPNAPTTVTFVNWSKFPTMTKTELVVSVIRMLPSGGDTLTWSGGGGV